MRGWFIALLFLFGAVWAETRTVPLYISGAIDPLMCLTDGLLAANPNLNVFTPLNNATIALSWSGSGCSVDLDSYCQGCLVENATTIPTLLRVANFTTNSTYAWTMQGNASATPIACTTTSDCTSFWDTQWPVYRGSLTGTQCVACSYGYCRGGAQLDDDGFLVTNPATCAGFEPIKTEQTHPCIEATGLPSRLINDVYTKMTLNVQSPCACQQCADTTAPSNSWRQALYSNSTDLDHCCLIRPTCDNTRPSYFIATSAGPGPNSTQNVLTIKLNDYPITPNRNGAADIYNPDTFVSCTYASDCDCSADWQALLAFTYSNITNILYGMDSSLSAYGSFPIGAACIRNRCYPMAQEFMDVAPLGWDTATCEPSLRCSYGLHDVYLPPNSASSVDLNATLFNVPFANPCSGAYGVGQVTNVTSPDCPAAVFFNVTSQTWKLVPFTPPSSVPLPLTCHLQITCDNSTGYFDCDGPGPNARGSIYNIFFIGRAPLPASTIAFIIIAILMIIALLIFVLVFCARASNRRPQPYYAYQPYPEGGL